MRYDYAIIGSGMYGATFARMAADLGNTVLVIDRRLHVGGNCYTEEQNGIHVHKYGAHIFHTNSHEIWEFASRFTIFNNYIHRVKVAFNQMMLPFPITMHTLRMLWGVDSPEEAEARIARTRIPIVSPVNAHDWLVSQIGCELYETFFEGYTIKQWGRDPRELPASIVRRIPFNLNSDGRYFTDVYQGIPSQGYTRMFENMLDHPLIELRLGIDYQGERTKIGRLSNNIIYTGPIDELYEYEFGPLDYRSLCHIESVESGAIQDVAVVNYPEKSVPFTRIIEHVHFQKHIAVGATVITREYPSAYRPGGEAYYPVRDNNNLHRHSRYRVKAMKAGISLGGRLATYQYYDMHQAIAQAMADFRRIGCA